MLIAAIALLAYMVCVYIYALFIKNNSIADIAYGGGFILVSFVALMAGNKAQLSWFLFLLIVLWGVRLSTRIYMRNKGKPEDFRYAAWREKWKWAKLRSFLQIFVLQGVIIYVISLPAILVMSRDSLDIMPLYIFLGVCLWLTGFTIELVGDKQLDAFLKISPQKRPTKYIESGLWRYTRHPNYFGEAVLWWGIAFFALGALPSAPYVFISPILITYLLLFVSGVPLLEKRWEGDKDWATYKSKTSMFFPLPPKNSKKTNV
jgi:steroid 5-alpha reductase family enzyme